MQYSVAILGLLAAATSVSAQGVTALITPTAAAPAGCSATATGDFQITVVNTTILKRNEMQKVCLTHPLLESNFQEPEEKKQNGKQSR